MKMKEKLLKLLEGCKIIEITGLEKQSREVIFVFWSIKVKFCHHQDCCEDLYLEEFEGGTAEDFKDATIIAIEETTKHVPDGKNDVEDWTFYNIKTDKGDLNLRFICESNGYYSTSVDFEFEGTA